MDFPAPIAMYDAAHAEVVGKVGASVDGLLLHLGRPTRQGFQVVEVWESASDFHRYNEEVVGPILAQLSDGQPPSLGEATTEEFEVRGLVIPRAGVVV
jgi:hypothetical protein